MHKQSWQRICQTRCNIVHLMYLHKVSADTKLVFHLQTVQGTPVADAPVSALTSQQVMINRYDADLLMSIGCKHTPASVYKFCMCGPCNIH